jgi:alpha/beta superfamily hydrolase
MRRTGAVAMRFNYRGVNMSEGSYDNGVGELEDARAALEFLRSRYTKLPFTLAGFSFGSRIILKLGCQIPGPTRLIAVGFPAADSASRTLGACEIPRVFIQSTNDEFGPRDAMESYFTAIAGPKELIWIEARDHFFAGGLDQFEQAMCELAN